MPWLEIWTVFKKFWYFVPIIGLTFAVLFMRGSLAHKDTELTVANAKVGDLTKANQDAHNLIVNMAANRVDNDAIAKAVAAIIGTNTVRETNTRTIIEKAAINDPAIRDWLSVPVPASVRGALSPDRPKPAPSR